jgi:hypothetical protein
MGLLDIFKRRDDAPKAVRSYEAATGVQRRFGGGSQSFGPWAADLMTGQALVAVYDSNGERVEFRPANRDALRLYILDLKSQIAGAAKPARMIQFQTGKGV